MSRSVRLDLSAEERALLKSLPQQLIALLDSEEDDPSLHRLFPPAYGQDASIEYESEYRRLMGADLRERHRASLEVLAATADLDELDDDQAQSWLIALNELRLVLGTRLDIRDDDEELDPSRPEAAVYQYLSYLQEAVLDQLTE